MKNIMLLLVSFTAVSFAAHPQNPNYINEPSTDFDNRLSWFTNAKYGMFIHFGLYRQHKTLVKIMK